MAKRKLQFAALCLAVVMLFSGCGSILDALLGIEAVNYADMEYTRPDMAELEQVLAESCEAATSGKNLEEVIDGIYAFYEVYDRFYTNYSLADIRYSGDLTDTYWEAEYNFCLENTSAADAGLDALYYALADSPFREELESEEYFGAGYFDAYEGESIWDDTFTALMEQEAQLQSRYYDLASQALAEEYYSEEYFSQYGTQMADLFVELIALRQQIAAYAGYDSYPEFAYDMYHYRDYTPDQAEEYLVAVGEELGDIYRQINVSSVWNIAYDYCSESQTYQYVKTAAENMGGSAADAFNLLEKAGLYDISYGENKYDSSYEVYLWSYYEPFIFMNPTMGQYDQLTFAHEFGHFINDYVCYGSYAGTDVAEVHSQAMEYLSLCYGEDTDALTSYKMADSLCTYMEQAAYGLFEQRVYALSGEDLTAENVQALYEEIGYAFGFDSWAWDSRDYVTVTHFFTSPMYIISYVVSNDVALQIYQQEKAETGAGLETFEACVESGDSYLLYFAETYGLESPFAEGRLTQVRQTLETELADYLNKNL